MWGGRGRKYMIVYGKGKECVKYIGIRRPPRKQVDCYVRSRRRRDDCIGVEERVQKDVEERGRKVK